jgi:uncharacterized RmlC-like cupin family protein
MKMRRLPSHPAFKLEGSRFFRSFWELELTPGEETDAHQHADSEEVLYIVSGEAIITVAADERPVQPGEVVLVPPRTDHIIANRSGQLLQALQVESRLPAASAPGEVVEPIVPDEAARKTVQTIESLISGLPKDVDEAVAIRTIVELFDIGGGLTERIEKALGLDNEDGVNALGQVEQRIMQAVVEITARYRNGGRGYTNRLWG